MTGISGDYGKNLNNNILFNNNKKAEQAKQPETKEVIDLTGAKYLGEKTDLGKTPESIYGAMGLQLSKTTNIQKQFEAALDTKTLKYIQNTPPEVAARIGNGAKATFAALEATEEFLV